MWKQRLSQGDQEHKDNVLQHWLQLLSSGKHADMEFKVGDKVLPAHKIVLVTRVPYFEKMFESGMKEAKTNIVEIKDVTTDTWIKFLGFVYTGRLTLADFNEAEVFLKLADMYDFPQLKKRCSESFEDNITKTNVCKILILAQLTSSLSLKAKCIKFIKKHDRELDRKVLEELLPHPDLMLDVINNVN